MGNERYQQIFDPWLVPVGGCGMTKNEDVSWIPKIGRVSLKGFSTTDLIAELCKREGVDIMTIPPENTAYTRVWHNVTRNDTSYGIVMDNTRFINGPAKIIVVRGE